MEFVSVKEEFDGDEEEILIKPEPILVVETPQEDQGLTRKRKRSEDSWHSPSPEATPPASPYSSLLGLLSAGDEPEQMVYEGGNWNTPSRAQTSNQEDDESRELLTDVGPVTASLMTRDSDHRYATTTSSDRPSRTTPIDSHSTETPIDHHSTATPPDRHSRTTPIDRPLTAAALGPNYSPPSPSKSTVKQQHQKVGDALDEALLLVVGELRALRQQQQQRRAADPVDAFCRFMCSGLRRVSAEQRDICQALCFNALRRGRRGGLSEEHRIVRVEAV